MCNNNLICVYADVNGLHEMNNKEGHLAGDRMLQEVARVMQQRFGTEDTYRIGGDEFVGFRVDGHMEYVSSEIDQMNQELAQKGYHVSFGSSSHEVTQDEFDMQSLVKEAESKMFDAKRNTIVRWIMIEQTEIICNCDVNCGCILLFNNQ